MSSTGIGIGALVAGVVVTVAKTGEAATGTSVAHETTGGVEVTAVPDHSSWSMMSAQLLVSGRGLHPRPGKSPASREDGWSAPAFELDILQ